MDQENSALQKKWYVRLLNPWVAIPSTLVFTLFCTPFLYRAYKLNSIPKIDLPYDGAALLKSHQVDPAENALADFQKAISLRTTNLEIEDWEIVFEEIRSGKITTKETKEVITFLDANQPAINAWRIGTSKNEFREIPLEQIIFPSPSGKIPEEAKIFNRYLIAEAERNLANGNPREAIGLYLDSFRTSLLTSKDGSFEQTLNVYDLYEMTTKSLIENLRHDSFSEEDLQTLSINLKGVQQEFLPISITYKIQYYIFFNEIEKDPTFLLSVLEVPSYIPEKLSSSYLYFNAEPEMSKRFLKQWMSNILPNFDLPRSERSP